VFTLLLALPGLPRLKLRTDGQALLKRTAPEVVYDKAIRAKFGLEDQIVVLIESAENNGIYTPETLQLVRDLTAQLSNLPGIGSNHVISLAHEPSFRLKPGTLVHENLLDPPLNTKAELDQLREDLRRIELYTSTLVSPDGKATVILVGVPAQTDRSKFYQQVKELVGRANVLASQTFPPKLAVTGAPAAESLLGVHILEDLGVPKMLLGASTRSNAEQSGLALPKSLRDLRLLLARRLGLVPVAILVMMLIFLASFRSVLAMLLPLPGLGAALIAVFGLMGWVGAPVYLTIAVMPVLLTATGVTNDIYLFSRYFTLLRERAGASHIHILQETFRTMAAPVAATSLTAAIGFFSFCFSPLEPVKAFGVFTGIGVLFGLLFSFTGVPALLALVGPAWARSEPTDSRTAEQLARGLRPFPPGRGSGKGGLSDQSHPSQSSSFLADNLARLGATVVHHRWWTLAAIVLAIATTPLGLRKLVVQDSWMDAFDPGSDFRRASLAVNNEFYGMHLLFVTFDIPQALTAELQASAFSPEGIILSGNLAEKPGLIAGSTLLLKGAHAPPLRSHIEMALPVGTNVLARIPRQDIPTNGWPQFLGTGRAHMELTVRSQCRPEIIKETGKLAAFIRERSRYAVGGVLGPYEYLTTTRFMARPNDPQARVLPDDPGEMKLMWDYYGLARGPQRLRQIVDSNYWQSVTTIFLKDANFQGTARLMSDIRKYESENLSPRGIKLGFAGDVALSQSLIRGIVDTQIQSLFWSMLGIYLITSLLGHSFRWGLICVLPSLFAIWIKFGIMGWCGIPLGVATSMFAAMTLGIGVNCAIQLLEAYDLARAAGSAGPTAMQEALRLSGPAASINTIAVSTGFGVLMLSQVPANARLGFLVVVGLAGCLVATLLMLPVLLHWWPTAKVKR
jgi:predicted RND superfamily exporter protein